jgi:dihydrofolate synthase / folylpolyglutamate synthase
MNYKEFLDYIYLRHSGNVKLGLDRMNNILSAMAKPNLKLHGIHIGGTNGKGSTAAICESLALNHSLSSGLNTSPHLIDYRERIRFNGKNITFKKLLEIYRKWEHILEKYEASFFEITTALAFCYFWEQQVDCAVFEVGLGGRLDGTNPFASTVSVITTVSYDHTKSLGNTIAKIAGEKAGIIKSAVPVVLGKMSPYAARKIIEHSHNKRAPVYLFGKDFTVSNIMVDAEGTTFDYTSPKLHLKNLTVNLLGRHQAVNAATAITAFNLFQEKTGRMIQENSIRKALRKVNWQGRLQILRHNPLVLIDGAHNEEGIKTLTTSLRKLFPGKTIRFVMAILRDKNLKNIIAEICSISHKIYISKNKSARAAEIAIQENYVKRSKIDYEIIHDVVEAAQKAVKDSAENDIVVISGSLYTISEVLQEKEQLLKI